MTPRASFPAATPPASGASEQPVSPTAEDEAPAERPVPQMPAIRSLATVTRLPVGPLMATPEIPEMPDLDADELDDLDALTSAVTGTRVDIRDATIASLAALRRICQ